MRNQSGRSAGENSGKPRSGSLEAAIAGLEAELEEAERRNKEIEESIQALGDTPTPGQFGLTESQYQRFRESENSNSTLWVLAATFTSLIFVWWLAKGVENGFGSVAAAVFLMFGYLAAGVVNVFCAAFGVFEKPKHRDKRYDAYLHAQSAHDSRLTSLERESKICEVRLNDLHHHVQQTKRRQQREHWFKLTGHQFEKELGEIFRQLGYETTVTPASGDFGVDIRITREDGKRAIIQCKAHKKPIGPGPVRELFGVLTHEQADKAVLFCLGGFTQGAKDFAKGKPIELADVNGVIRLHKKAVVSREALQQGIFEAPDDFEFV
ncbi:MAG TPA: DUF2034 domain-containing protein [Candidatus Hydrogenedentes bacterium]|nr:DUF2034 domain-containing protein [Candidatus Hydrogenedentota bacterium]HQH52590.1 DUF2034 domain-containing protein [Candidatus Hydrogenedentota bacterium]